VNPSQTDKYEIMLADLKDFLSEKNVQDFNYFTHVPDDYIFTHIFSINDLSDLSNGMHTLMAKKINDPELDLILDYYNEAIETYRYFIVRYIPELSYIPDGDDGGGWKPLPKMELL